MPSTKPYLRAAVLAALLSGAAQAESVVLHAEQATAGADTHTSANFAGKSAEEIAQGIMKAGQLTIDDENTAK